MALRTGDRGCQRQTSDPLTMRAVADGRVYRSIAKPQAIQG